MTRRAHPRATPRSSPSAPAAATPPRSSRACKNLGIFCRVIGDAKAVGNALDATTDGMDAIYELLAENA